MDAKPANIGLDKDARKKRSRSCQPGRCKKGLDMIRKYIEAAMEHAKYEILQDDGTYYGEIKECPGVYSNAQTLEKCRNELEEVLEEWILFRVYKNLEIPPIDNIEIKIKKQEVA
jgi:predicted RNase H-like HicB family nuclease